MKLSSLYLAFSYITYLSISHSFILKSINHKDMRFKASFCLNLNNPDINCDKEVSVLIPENNLLNKPLDDSNSEIDNLEDLDIEFSLEKAVKQMVESGSKPTEIDPKEKFDEIYKENKLKKKNLKANKDKKTRKLDADAMLKELFPVEEVRDPFDEKTVISKLRQILDEQDFKSLFLDTNIGDLY